MASYRFYGGNCPTTAPQSGHELTAQHSSDTTQRARSGRPFRGVLWLLILGAGWSAPIRAWDDFGHMTVAAVAWQHLTPAARTQASELLRQNPDYSDWVHEAPSAEQQWLAFLKASTWPDAIKHEAGYRNDGERPSATDANQNVGYDDHAEHRYWHYVDIPFSPDATPLPPVPVPNAATRIADFRTVLSDPQAPASLKSYDLVWLLHLVGDIHQPLHAVSRFTHTLPEGDLGGNRVRLCAPPCREELHGFWDDAVGHGTARQAFVLAKTLPTPPLHRIADTRIEDWVNEGTGIARTIVYRPPVGDGPGPYRLTRGYRDQARRVARERVALAGRRLAVLLNYALTPRRPGTGPAPRGSPPIPLG